MKNMIIRTGQLEKKLYGGVKSCVLQYPVLCGHCYVITII